MNKEVRTMMEKEIKAQIEYIGTLTPGTPEHDSATESLIKLHQAFDNERNYMWKRWVDGGKILVPVIFGGVWMSLGFKFEKDGNFTSKTFQTLWNKFNFMKIS